MTDLHFFFFPQCFGLLWLFLLHHVRNMAKTRRQKCSVSTLVPHPDCIKFVRYENDEPCSPSVGYGSWKLGVWRGVWSTSEGWAVRTPARSMNHIRWWEKKRMKDGEVRCKWWCKMVWWVEHKTGQKEHVAVMDHRGRKWSRNTAWYAHYHTSGSPYWLRNSSA